MKSNDELAYRLRSDEALFVADLRARWASSASQELLSSIKEAIRTVSELPTTIPTTYRHLEEKKVALADLSGIDLREVTFGDMDLSYCCFDGAQLDSAEFNGTHLQFSSFSHASLGKTVWTNVQASPISAGHASFRGARIQNSSLVNSNFEKSDFSEVSISDSRLALSTFIGATFSRQTAFKNVDTAGVTLPDGQPAENSWEKHHSVKKLDFVPAPLQEETLPSYRDTAKFPKDFLGTHIVKSQPGKTVFIVGRSDHGFDIRRAFREVGVGVVGARNEHEVLARINSSNIKLVVVDRRSVTRKFFDNSKTRNLLIYSVEFKADGLLSYAIRRPRQEMTQFVIGTYDEFVSEVYHANDRP